MATEQAVPPIESSSRVRAIERAVAAIAFAPPVLYVLTEHTGDIFMFTWSRAWTVLALLVTAGYVTLLFSYSRSRARWFEVARRVSVVGVASATLALVGVELVLRASDAPRFEPREDSGRHAADPDVGHIYVANHRQVLQTREASVEWASNAQGVRAERDFGPKPQGLTRILCVGDEFTAGDQVPYAQSWPAALEARLGARLAESGSARKVEVVNAGFPGYSTANEAAWIAKFGRQFEPDLVLVATNPGDLSENPFPLQYSAREGALVSARATEADRERARHRGRWWCLAGAIERSRLLARLAESSRVRSWLGRPPVPDVEAYQEPRDETSERLHELADRCMLEARGTSEALGARFGIVVIPRREQLLALPPGLDGEAYGRHWREFASEHHIAPCIDARAAFLAHGDVSALYGREDEACTAAGCALVAQAVADGLWELRTELGWTP